MMRLLLIALALSISACATLPAPGTELREYRAHFDPIAQPVPLTPAAVEVHQGRVCLVDEYAFFDFIGDAHANTQALGLAIDAYAAKHAELMAILAAGQQAEIHAEIYHGLATGYSSMVERLAWPAVGVGALMLLLISL